MRGAAWSFPTQKKKRHILPSLSSPELLPFYDQTDYVPPHSCFFGRPFFLFFCGGSISATVDLGGLTTTWVTTPLTNMLDLQQLQFSLFQARLCIATVAGLNGVATEPALRSATLTIEAVGQDEGAG